MKRAATLIAAMAACAGPAFARAGGGGGFHGGYSGGSYGGHGSSGGSGAGYLVYLYFQLLIDYPGVMIPLTLVLIGVVVYWNRTGLGVGGGDGDTVEELPGQAASAYSEQVGQSRRQALEAIRGRDPAFDEAAFIARASAAFLVIQDAWSRQDMSRARAFISDGVYERFSRQIAEQKAEGVRNRMQGVQVLAAEAVGYQTGPHFDSIYVRVRASAQDEMVSLADESVISSDDGEFTEVWTFLRRPGAKTLARPGLLEGHCPNCGAPLAVADAAQCAACKSWVNSGEHDWVLVTITQAGEWAFPNPAREITGWADMRAADPGLSLESLEDRASMVFWRGLDSRRRQDLAPMRGVATPELLGMLTFDGSFERDAAVGSVAVVAFEVDEKSEHAHVQVRWEAESCVIDDGKIRSSGRRRYTHFLIFRRNPGVLSDPKSGLRAARCPACGAPPSEPDAASCAYCGKAFNDGSLGWVLSRIVPFGEWRRPNAAPDAPMALYGLDWGDELPPNEAVAVLALGIATAGSAVNDAEKAFLLAYAAKRGVSEEAASRLVQAAQERKLDLPPPADAAQAEAILRGIIRMELTAGEIDPAARAALAAYGARYGLGEADVSGMIREELQGVRGKAAAAPSQA